MDRSSSNIALGFYARSGYEMQALFLLRSVRTFGGEMANLPVWIFYPQEHPLNPSTQDKLNTLGADSRSFKIDETFLKFPFAGKAAASAAAERMAEDQNILLAWHDRTGMIRKAPLAFHLPDEIAIGFRPTDIANIGAPFGQPLPPFWADICSHFNIEPEDLPPITTCIDRKTCHLYVNAGLLVVQSNLGILRKWAEALKESYALPQFLPYYRENQAYAIFMHQAVLSAVVAAATNVKERMILPAQYLFSVDNFFDYPREYRPESLDEIITGRFHDFFALENWEDKVIASDKLISWFRDQLKEGAYWPEAI